MNEQKKKGQSSSRTWAKFGTKSSKGGQKGPEAGKAEAGRRLPATPPREAKGRPQKKKKINKSEIGMRAATR